jgi:NAD+ kinase
VEIGLTWDEEQVKPLLAASDMVVVLGGDGSMLRAARMTAANATPIVGVNMGRLGFLSEMGPANWRERLPKVLDGEYWIEERMMLQTETWRDDQQIARHVALNDVVISRGGLARVIRMRTEIDGDPLTTYIADGLIVSTPTGSTAYALAVGGPILPPELHNILVLPIAPHLTLDRAIVLAEGSTIRVNLKTDHQAILTVDGQFEVELKDGDFIDVCASEDISRFVRLGQRTYFYHTLLARLEPKQAASSAD